MFNIIKASLFKLFRDKTFHITAIIGTVLALLIIAFSALTESLNGHSLFLSAFIPSNNFGLTIPINLIAFTVCEFTYGTIRNKIIAGLSKTKIYIGLFITGLVFTFILAIYYGAIIIGLSSAIGGFDASKIGGVNFVLCYLAYTVATYVLVSSLSVFFASIFRQIGGSITIVIILLVFLSLLPLIIFPATVDTANITQAHWSMCINPFYMAGFYGNSVVSLLAAFNIPGLFDQTPQMIAAGIVTPFVWATLLFIGGIIIFKHRDIK